MKFKEIPEFMAALPKERSVPFQVLQEIVPDSVPDVDETIKWKTLTCKRKA